MFWGSIAIWREKLINYPFNASILSSISIDKISKHYFSSELSFLT